MGLDVTVSFCANLKEELRKQEEASKLVDALYSDVNYESLSEEQKDEIRAKSKEIYAMYDLDEYGSAKNINEVDGDSTLYPEHMFKLGYYRSSYNGAGTNSVLRKRLGYDMYEIFGRTDNDEYYFVPDWNATLARLNKAVEDMEKYLSSPIGNYDAYEVDGMDAVSDERAALQVFVKQLERKGDYNYSCREGHFFLAHPLKVVGFIPGNPRWGSPRSYLIIEKEQTGEKDWYLQALEIMRESVQHVVAQPNVGDYFLRWSA